MTATIGMPSLFMETPVDEQQPAPRPGISAQVFISVGTFLIGIIFAVGMGWGSKTANLDGLNSQLTIVQSTLGNLSTQLTTKFDSLSNQVNQNNLDTSVRLRTVEDQVKSLQTQVDEMRGRQEHIRP